MPVMLQEMHCMLDQLVLVDNISPQHSSSFEPYNIIDRPSSTLFLQILNSLLSLVAPQCCWLLLVKKNAQRDEQDFSTKDQALL